MNNRDFIFQLSEVDLIKLCYQISYLSMMAESHDSKSDVCTVTEPMSVQ